MYIVYVYHTQGCGSELGSGVFVWIRFRIRFSNFFRSGFGVLPGFGSGSDLQISLDPEPVSVPGSWISDPDADRQKI